MFWPLILSAVLFAVGAIVFVLTRDSFRLPRSRREAAAAVPRMKKNGDAAAAINTLMQEKFPAPPPSNPAALFSGQCGKEADAFADTLSRVKENPILPNAPNAYLRLEERDESLEHLLAGRAGRYGQTPPPKEFSIEVTEKKEAPLEHT